MYSTTTYQFKWAWSLTEGHRRGLLFYFILEVFAIASSLMFVIWSKEVVDIAVRSSSGALKYMITKVILAMLLALICRTFAGWLNERIRLKMGLDLQKRIIDAQMRSVWKQVKAWHSGDIQLRIQSDCNEVVQMVGFSAIASLLTLIRLIASFGILWSMDPMLAIMLLAITPLFLCSKLYFKKMRSLNQWVKTEESNFSKMLQENLRFRMLIRAMDFLNLRQSKLEQSQLEVFKLKNEQLNFVFVSQTVMKFTIQAGFLLTFIWGVYQLHSEAITFGTMTAFLQLVGRVQAPILTLFGFVPTFIRFRTSLERVMELKDVDKEETVVSVPLNPIREIRFLDVWFQYEDRELIQEFNARVKRGESLAIVGPSGKGKTTLFRLLLGIVTPDKGTIHLVSDKGIFKTGAAYRCNYAYVPQGNSLFTGTIRENLGIEKQTPSENNHIKSALWAACADFIYELPDGLDTFIGESGYGLSEGQAQRIAIARALIQNTDVWLFDEVTSALDEPTSNMLINRILQVGRDKLCLFITHDLKLSEKCTQTFYMN